MADMQLINRNDIVWRLGCNDDGCTVVYARSTDIDAMPTIDAVPVVRCKDCKHWERNIGVVDSPNGYCFYNDDVMNGFDFCSHGERKDDGA